MTDTAIEKTTAVAVLVTKVEPAGTLDAAQISTWLVKLMMAGARAPGFWSGEIMPPGPQGKGWSLLQRFSTTEQADSFKQSEARKTLLAEFPGGTNNGATYSDDIGIDESASSNVATAIVTDVKPGMEEQYFAWEDKIQIAQARFPGYRGNYFQPPAQGTHGKWVTLVRFDLPETLQKWFACDQRKQLLDEGEKFVTATKFKTVTGSFPGWFPTDDQGNSPDNWKTAMLVLLGLFPTVMLEMKFLSPQLTALNPAVASFLNLVLSVGVTTWGTTPVFIKLFTWWLYPDKEHKKEVDLKGLLIMAGLFLGEIALLWTLLLK